MVKYVLSAFADEYDQDFQTQLIALNGYGIKYIEIRGVNGKNVSLLSDEEVENVKNLLDKYGIKVSAIGSPIGKIHIDGDMNEHFDMAKRVFITANKLNARFVRAFSFYPPKTSALDYENEVFTAMDKLVALANEYGVVLCHENEKGIYGETAENCKKVISRYDGALKAVFDMGNFTLEKHNPQNAYEILRDDIAYFHIKDALGAGAIVPAGKGEAKIYEILSDYARYANGEIFVALEPHLQTFDGLNALTSAKFDNPYKYENQRRAFDDAVAKFKEILLKI